jgi:hypothetical protein
MVRVWYKVNGVEYSDLLGLDELDPNASIWDNITKVEHQDKEYATPPEISQFKRAFVSCS